MLSRVSRSLRVLLLGYLVLSTFLGSTGLISANSLRAQASSLTIVWEYDRYFALPERPITLYAVISNALEEDIDDVAITLDLPESVHLYYEEIASNVITIDRIGAGKTIVVAWTVVPAESGEFSLTLRSEEYAPDNETRAVLHVGRRGPSLGYYYNNAFVLVSGLGPGEIANTVYAEDESPSSIPLVGDWNGDGYSGLGLYRDNQINFLTDLTTGGQSDLSGSSFVFGDFDSAIPLVGDWNGDGTDSIMLYVAGTFYLRHFNAAGYADATFVYGPQDGESIVPLVGDWNGDGVDTVGIYQNGNFYLRNSNTGGEADINLAFGPSSGAVPLVGDWNGDGIDTIGVFVGDTLYLRDTNDSGYADATITIPAIHLLLQDNISVIPFVGYWYGADN